MGLEVFSHREESRVGIHTPKAVWTTGSTFGSIRCEANNGGQEAILMAIDPVCGIHIDEKAAEATEQYTSQYGSETFYFCSQDCQDQFEEAPEQYARKSA